MNEVHKTIEDFFTEKSEYARALFSYFINKYAKLGVIHLHGAKTMAGIANEHKRIAWITQFGKNFIHVVFPFSKAYIDNVCFQKIAQVPGDDKQFNHHFRMLYNEEVNEEVKRFMKLALNNKEV